MFPEYFQSAWRVRDLRVGPAAPLVTSFGDKLRQDGYAELTARRHLRSAEHLAHWASRVGIALDGPIEAILDSFDRHVRRRRQCRAQTGRPFGHTFRVQILGSARPFLRHLADAGLAAHPRDNRIASSPPMFVGFCQWMQQQRGTCDSTLSNYGIDICALLKRVGDDPGRWDARSLREFIMEGSRTSGWAAAKRRTTALRMLLRFLIAEGRCASGLVGAIPVLLHRRLSSLPRYLSADDVERVIASCDRASAVGQRDHAILLLLARLGLRAGDIVQLRLRDIDWKGAWIHVLGKGRRETRLPLTHELGEALVTYLTRGRPQTDTDVVFVRSRPPFRPFRSHCAVSVIVDRAFAHAKVSRPSRGAAHLLRHSVATSMLRHGASLQDVASLLRHRSVTTTEIYAKVDVTTLQMIAQPWPEVAGTSEAATTTYAYEPVFHQLATVTDPLLHTWTPGYNAQARLTSSTDPLSHQSTIVLNGVGQVRSVTDPLTHQWQKGLPRRRSPLDDEPRWVPVEAVCGCRRTCAIVYGPARPRYEERCGRLE